MLAEQSESKRCPWPFLCWQQQFAGTSIFEGEAQGVSGCMCESRNWAWVCVIALYHGMICGHVEEKRRKYFWGKSWACRVAKRHTWENVPLELHVDVGRPACNDEWRRVCLEAKIFQDKNSWVKQGCISSHCCISICCMSVMQPACSASQRALCMSGCKPHNHSRVFL